MLILLSNPTLTARTWQEVAQLGGLYSAVPLMCMAKQTWQAIKAPRPPTPPPCPRVISGRERARVYFCGGVGGVAGKARGGCPYPGVSRREQVQDHVSGWRS